jgi:alpha-beta hydrolase superfamily lysophospholipase
MTSPTLIPNTPGEGTTRMPDGTILRTLEWPVSGEPWAVALIVHGLGEHGGRYGPVARAMTAAGIEVHAYDHRGFGGSAGPRAYIERWSIYHDDLDVRITALRETHAGLPLILYGHSLGGLVAIGYVLSDTPRPMPDLLVLSAPGIEATVPGWKRRLAAALTGIVPRMRLANGLPDDGLSRDPTVRALADADPLCMSTSTVRLGAEAFKEQERVQAAIARLDRLPVPTYVFHGSADPIVPVTASERLEGKANVTRRVHDGLRHECHHEPEHEDVLAEVVAWIRANAPAAEQTGAGVPVGAGAVAV